MKSTGSGIGKRIVVVGTSGSGKTTMATRIAEKLKVPRVEMDALHWEPNWVEAPLDVFRERLENALTGDSWVVDGNYSKVRDILWQRADTIVWLDYPLHVVMSRLFIRTCRRSFLQEELWSGNKENWKTHLFTNDSIFLWAWTTYPRHRRDYPELFNLPEHSHLHVIRLTGPRQGEQFLDRLSI